MKTQKTAKSLKNLFLLIPLFLLLTFTASNTLADFYVIAGSRGVGTKITSLPAIISSSGFYFIDKDLSCATGNHGITINADNVTLDLMGFSLIGPGGTNSYDGIYMHTRTNVEIRNGIIRNFGHNGITEAQTAGTSHRIINIRFQDNTAYATYLRSTGNLIEKCTAVNNGYGFYSRLSSTITGNTCYNNTNYGISVYMGSTVIGNTCYDNGANGIAVSNGSTVVNNTCYSNNNYGMRVLALL